MVSSGEGKQEAAISHSGGGGSSGKGSLAIRSRSKEIEEPLVLGYREQGVSLKSKIWSPVSEGERSKLRVGGGVPRSLSQRSLGQCSTGPHSSSP